MSWCWCITGWTPYASASTLRWTVSPVRLSDTRSTLYMSGVNVVVTTFISGLLWDLHKNIQ